MDDPCIICLLHPCCSEPCIDYAKYVYETKQYSEAGIKVATHIEDMSYDKAIAHILKVESLYFWMKSSSQQYFKKE